MSRIKTYVLGGLLAVFALLAGGWGLARQTIQADVNRFSELAQQSFPTQGDDVAALIAFMESEANSLRDRNQAVWALGQLRDPRALPALEAAYTGEPCDHSRLLCQRELGKAIECCRGEALSIMFVSRRR